MCMLLLVCGVLLNDSCTYVFTRVLGEATMYDTLALLECVLHRCLTEHIDVHNRQPGCSIGALVVLVFAVMKMVMSVIIIVVIVMGVRVGVGVLMIKMVRVMLAPPQPIFIFLSIICIIIIIFIVQWTKEAA